MAKRKNSVSFYKSDSVTNTNEVLILNTRIYWNIEENGNFRFTHLDYSDDDDQTIELEIDKRQSVVRIIYGSM